MGGGAARHGTALRGAQPCRVMTHHNKSCFFRMSSVPNVIKFSNGPPRPAFGRNTGPPVKVKKGGNLLVKSANMSLVNDNLMLNIYKKRFVKKNRSRKLYRRIVKCVRNSLILNKL